MTGRRLLIILLVTLQLGVGLTSALGSPSYGDEKSRNKVLGEFVNRFKITNKYVLVKPGLREAKLLELAKKLHRAEPKVAFWFLDDDAQFPQLLKSLPEVEAGNSANVPFDWFKKHVVANMQEWISSEKGRYWVLCKGDGVDKIAEIN
jgi:hypothetical protein